MRKTIADLLRLAAHKIDGREFVSTRWHKLSVQSMNRYIGQTEAYVADLEYVLPEGVLSILRSRHGRADNRELVKNGVWPEANDDGVEVH